MKKMIYLVGFVLSIFLIAMKSKNDESYKSHYMEVDGIKLHYKKGGRGPCLLLLHGFTLSSEQWAEYFDDFSKSYTVIALDLPGHGQSERTGEKFSFEHWTHLIIKAMDQLELKKFRAIGHSYGAITLMSVARQRPDLLEAMILISGAHRFEPTMRKILLEDSFNKADISFQEYYRKIHFNNLEQIEGLFTDIRKLAEPREVLSLSKMKENQVPTLLVFGDRDPYYPLEIVLELYEALPNVSLWILPGQGHTPVWKEMDGDNLIRLVFLERVKKFLN